MQRLHIITRYCMSCPINLRQPCKTAPSSSLNISYFLLNIYNSYPGFLSRTKCQCELRFSRLPTTKTYLFCHHSEVNMADSLLCDICKKLFWEEQFDRDEQRFIHHSNAGAFQQALKLPCALCWRIKIATSRDNGKLLRSFVLRYKTNCDIDTSIADMMPITYAFPLSPVRCPLTKHDLVYFFYGSSGRSLEFVFGTWESE
jgi:hypothetical protein